MKPSLPILLLALAAGCAGRRPAPSTTAAQAPVEPVQYTYVVKASYPHLTTSYTQGLYFDDGFLWEGTDRGDGGKGEAQARARAIALEILERM